jgi:hypothetical protein
VEKHLRAKAGGRNATPLGDGSFRVKSEPGIVPFDIVAP